MARLGLRSKRSQLYFIEWYRSQAGQVVPQPAQQSRPWLVSFRAAASRRYALAGVLPSNLGTLQHLQHPPASKTSENTASHCSGLW